MRLFTRQVGNGPLVVVLHGGPGASHDYLLPQYDLLATRGGRSLLYYDQRGGGQSPVPRDTPLGWREHVADLEALRGEHDLEQLTLCGYSWGGLLAVLYFLEHPERVARLALVSPAGVTAEYRYQDGWSNGFGDIRRHHLMEGDTITVEDHAGQEGGYDAFWVPGGFGVGDYLVALPAGSYAIA